MRGKYVIAGIGHTKFGRLPGRGPLSMNVEACRNALKDAGIEKSAVDALFVKVPTSRYSSMYGQALAEAMRLQPKVGGVWDQGGATNISTISFACMAIDAGQCDVAIVCLADDPKTGTRQAYEKAWGDDAAYGAIMAPPTRTRRCACRSRSTNTWSRRSSSRRSSAMTSVWCRTARRPLW
jgi:acetyl-CoA acetyltransferase